MYLMRILTFCSLRTRKCYIYLGLLLVILKRQVSCVHGSDYLLKLYENSYSSQSFSQFTNLTFIHIQLWLHV